MPKTKPDEQYQREVSEYIKEARELLGLSKQELADKIEYTRRSVDYWESGDKTPRTLVLRHIGSMLQMEGHNLTPPSPPE